MDDSPTESVFNDSETFFKVDVIDIEAAWLITKLCMSTYKAFKVK